MLEDRTVWRGLTMALRAPPFLYSWDDRAEIVESLRLLREALSRMPPRHPAWPEMLNAARLIDQWLSSNPAIPEQKASAAGPRAWNEDLTPTLINTWDRIEPLFQQDAVR